MKNTISFFLVIILSLSSVFNCSQKGDDSSKSDILGLLLATSRNGADPDYRLCASAVNIMNSCIGSNNGYSYTFMCSSSKLQAIKTAAATITKAGGVDQVATTTGTTVTAVTSDAIWSSIVSCVSTKVATTYCNLDQNKVMDARIADALAPGFGAACDAFAGTSRLNAIDPAVRTAPGK
jgi:hypothetical protein